MYKFLRYVNFEDVINSALLFLRITRPSQIHVLCDKHVTHVTLSGVASRNAHSRGLLWFDVLKLIPHNTLFEPYGMD